MNYFKTIGTALLLSLSIGSYQAEAQVTFTGRTPGIKVIERGTKSEKGVRESIEYLTSPKFKKDLDRLDQLVHEPPLNLGISPLLFYLTLDSLDKQNFTYGLSEIVRRVFPFNYPSTPEREEPLYSEESSEEEPLYLKGLIYNLIPDQNNAGNPSIIVYGNKQCYTPSEGLRLLLGNEVERVEQLLERTVSNPEQELKFVDQIPFGEKLLRKKERPPLK